MSGEKNVEKTQPENCNTFVFYVGRNKQGAEVDSVANAIFAFQEGYQRHVKNEYDSPYK